MLSSCKLGMIKAGFRSIAELLLAAMLMIMFLACILQIAFRYLLDFPGGWTYEISVLMWVWMVLFGTAFVLRESEEIRFDLIYLLASGLQRRLMSIVACVAIIFLFAVSLPGAVDYILFMRVERTAYLRVRFDAAYSIYPVFVVAVLLRYLWLVWGLIARGEAKKPDLEQSRSVL